MELEQIILSITSSENDVREQAEKSFNEAIAANPANLLQGLCTLIRNSGNKTVKSMSAILFRKATSSIWDHLDGKESCCEALLAAWRQEQDKDVRNKICDAVSEVARKIAVHEEWPALLQLVFAADPANHEFCNSVLRVIIDVPEAFTATNERVRLMAEYLGACLGIPMLHVSVLEALNSLVAEVNEQQLAPFSPIFSKIPEILMILAQNKQSEALLASLQSVSALVNECPKLFKGQVEQLVNFCSSVIEGASHIAEDETDPVDLQDAAVELIVTLVESLPATFKKNGIIVSNIINVLLKNGSMALVDDKEWYQISPDEDFEEEFFSLTVEQAMDRISISLGGRVLLKPTLALITGMLGSVDWKHRYLALRAIANIAEGCSEELGDQLNSFLSLVWPSFKDPHPRVQYAACHALGQLCTDFCGTLQEDFAGACLESLVGLLASSDQHRVQCHAAAALINFAEGVESSTIEPVLDTLLSRLVGILRNGTPPAYLQEQVLATLAAFSTAAGKAFVPYIGQILPLLMPCIASAESSSSSSSRLLQCRALESATMIAVAVGKENFVEYTQELLRLMLTFQQSNLSPDDQLADYLTSAWVRMAQTLKSEDFSPFVPLILPKLIEQANVQPEVALLDSDAAEVDYSPEEWEFATVKGKRLGIHTASLDAKCAAVENLSIYISILDPLVIRPYMNEILNSLLPLLSFNMHEGVQIAAAETVATLAKSCKDLGQFCQMALSAMLEECGKERDAELIISFFESISDILNLENTCLYPANFMENSFACIRRVHEILLKHQKKLGEEEDEDEDSVDDEEVFYAITKLSASLFRVYREKCLGVADFLIQFCFRCINTGKPSLFKHASVCILDDLVHWLGEATAPLSQSIIHCFSTALQDEDDNDTRQAAAFGIGMCSEHAATVYRSFTLQALPLLLKLITAADSKAPSKINATDNAMSAVARICMAYPDSFDFGPILEGWIYGLPVTHDEDEAMPVYTFLYTLLRNGPTQDLILSSKPHVEKVREAIKIVLSHSAVKLTPELRAGLECTLSQL